VSLRKEVKSGKNIQDYAKSSKALEKLISNQQSYSGKVGLGYK